jgi:hypothetical protein
MEHQWNEIVKEAQKYIKLKKHTTPGPWVASWQPDGAYSCVRRSASISYDLLSGMVREHRQNALLMAAAPEMVTLLERIIENLSEIIPKK